MKSNFHSSASLPFTKDDCESADQKGAPLSEKANATLSVLMYVCCSVGMVLTNKCISVSLDPAVRDRMPQISVIAFQCFIAVVLVEIAKWYKFVDYPAFDMNTAKSWLPLNLLFVSMLCTGFLSLVFNNVPMVTVCKNLTNFFTIFGDTWFFGEQVGKLTLLSVLIMTSGAVFAGFNDLGFSWAGYMWMFLNCLSTSGYVLYMRYASTTIKLPKFGMVFYNNLLSMFILFPLIIAMGELPALMDPEIMTPYFIVSNIAAGFLGFYLNFASLWCVSTTSATTYAIVGSLNKVPITVLGFFMFDAALTSDGVWGIVIATLGGFLYAYSKIAENAAKQGKAKNSNANLQTTSAKAIGSPKSSPRANAVST
jgi:GDP-mannose transporter